MVRCAAWAREQSVDPIGTAGDNVGLVLVEWPPPWPKDVAAVEALAPATAKLAAAGVRLLLAHPSATTPGRARVVSFRRDGAADGFLGFSRREEQVDVEAVADAVLRIGLGDEAHEQPDAVDVLVCTHGARDTCCGAAGVRLAAAVQSWPEVVDGRLRVWRTSHLGGHRFAPTAVVMPHGTSWAHLDEALLRAAVTREGDLGVLLQHYRGCLGIAPAAAQALERLAFEEVGWAWLDRRRHAIERGDDEYAIVSVSPSGARRTWTGQVVAGRRLPVPVCRAPLAEATKVEPELVVTEWMRAPGG